jgi:hypothetical protein
MIVGRIILPAVGHIYGGKKNTVGKSLDVSGLLAEVAPYLLQSVFGADSNAVASLLAAEGKVIAQIFEIFRREKFVFNPGFLQQENIRITLSQDFRKTLDSDANGINIPG